MFYHLHIAIIHYGISTAKSINMTSMMLHNSSEHNQIIESKRNVLSDAYNNKNSQPMEFYTTKIKSKQYYKKSTIVITQNCNQIGSKVVPSIY
jgi:hypothetical protein